MHHGNLCPYFRGKDLATGQVTIATYKAGHNKQPEYNTKTAITCYQWLINKYTNLLANLHLVCFRTSISRVFVLHDPYTVSKNQCKFNQFQSKQKISLTETAVQPTLQTDTGTAKCPHGCRYALIIIVL